MSHLNQISHFLPPYNLMYPYRGPYYPYYLPDHIQEQNQQNRAYKIDVLKWLKSLDSPELYRIFQIKGQIKTLPILQMYIYDRLYVPSNYASKCQIDLDKKFDDQFIMKSKQNHHVKSEEFYDLLQITDEEKFMDSISLKEGTLSNMNQFLELLQEVTYQNFLSQIPQVTQEKVHDPEWFTQQCFRGCEEWIVKEFEKNIALNYAASHDRKKKIKLYNQTTIKNNNNELNNYFIKYLANNKEKLTYYFEQITTQMQDQPTLYEHRFYSNLFQGSVKTLKPQKEILISFLNKCHSDQNILQSMQLIKMNELLDQKTYYLKKFYPIILRLYQEHLEEELINYENTQKNKTKKDKKRKKIKNNKSDTNQQIQCIINEDQIIDQINEANSLKNQETLLLTQEIDVTIQVPDQLYDNLFEIYEQPKIKEQEEIILNSQMESTSIISNALESLMQEEIFLNLNLQDFVYSQMNKNSPQKFKDDTQLISPQSEMAQDIHCKTTQSYLSNRTDSFTEEENKNSTLFQDDEMNHYLDEQPHQVKIQEKDVEEQHQVVQQKLQTYQDIELKTQKSCQIESESLIQSFSTQCSVLQSCCRIQQLEVDEKIQKPDNRLKGKEKMFEIISINIIDFTDTILKDYDEMLPFRILTFERIKTVIQNAFFGIPDDMIKLFGSCATGLALIDSDIDIGINGFEQYSKIQLREPFQQLHFAFTQRKWVIKSRYGNHLIPVIKLEIDPAISFNEFDDYLNLSQEQQQILKKLKQRLKQGIKVDVSFSCYGNHLGYATTELVRQWMKEYPSIQQLVLLCKTIIKKLGLAESYKGGLSSYSLIVMIYSFLREDRIKSDSLGELFIDMMYFYSKEFDPSEIGIGLTSFENFVRPNEPSYFFKLKDYCLPKLPITIFSPLNKRLLTGSCTHINKLLQFFGTIYETSQQNCKFFETYVTFGKKKQQKLIKDIDDFILKILQLIQ